LDKRFHCQPLRRREMNLDSAGLVISNARLRDRLESLGLRRLSHEKRVPEEVWSWDRASQRAFLEGYLDADGHRPKNTAKHGKRSYASSSYPLISGVRLLHLIAGDAVSNIRTDLRNKPIFIKGVRVKNARPLHSFAVYEGRNDGYSHIRRRHGLGPFVEGPFGLRGVQSLEVLEEQTTYSVEVGGSDNLVADGIVVRHYDAPLTADK
jgi:hypothetical protein